MEEEYVNTAKAKQILGIHHRTLLSWDAKGKIDTIRTAGNNRLYNVKKYLAEAKNKQEKKKQEKKSNFVETPKENKLNICYVRVSSKSQADDLERQKDFMISKFPNHTVIEDIGSGLNLAKRGIKKIIKLAIEGKVNELVIAHKDRLTRFGFELIEDILETYSKAKIIIIEQSEHLDPEIELSHDIMSLMNVYVARMNGLRKYKIHQKTEI
jgi:putative resolvase